jgi:hypothetical protein
VVILPVFLPNLYHFSLPMAKARAHQIGRSPAGKLDAIRSDSATLAEAAL